FLPPAFSDFRVESGGVGAGTVTRFKVTAGGRTREYRMQVAEPEPGRGMAEARTRSSKGTTTTGSPRGRGGFVRDAFGWERRGAGHDRVGYRLEHGHNADGLRAGRRVFGADLFGMGRSGRDRRPV